MLYIYRDYLKNEAHELFINSNVQVSKYAHSQKNNTCVHFTDTRTHTYEINFWGEVRVYD
jgi:hypothetical protein